MASEPNKPVKVFRLKGVKAAVFQNKTNADGRDVTFHKVSLQRVYKEGEEFKTTTSFGRDDLPVARHLLDLAWQFILEKESSRGEVEE